MNVQVIMACHNRSETTIRSLTTLFEASRLAQVHTQVTLFDDGSSDGTATAVLAAFPNVHVLYGNGSTFWARSMYLAEKQVLESFRGRTPDDDDYIVWLNDDVLMDHDALSRVMATVRKHPEAVIVCAMRDPKTAQTTYSGYRRLGLHPLRLQMIEPLGQARPVDTFNGNLVLVPAKVALALRSIDGEYAHALADIDYGYRAKLAGVEVVLAPETYGLCPRNPASPKQSIQASWKSFTGVKGGGHPRSLLKILKLGSPRLWPLFMCATYFLWWLRAIHRELKLR